MVVDRARRLVERAGAEYCDFRLVRGPFARITLKDGEVEVEEGEGFGFSFRVLANGSWGFASANRENKLEEAFRRAVRLAKAGEGESGLSEEKAEKGRTKARWKKSFVEMDVEDKAAELREAEKLLRVPGITNTAVSYSDGLQEKVFLNSEGCEVVEEAARVYASLNAIARKGGEMGSGSERVGERGGWEAVGGLFEKASRAAEKALRALSAPRVKAGVYTVIVDGEMAGVMAHEAVGHACEADGVMAGDSILEGMVGKKIAADCITIIDDPALPRAFGGYAFDDEGTRARRKVLVEKGVLRGFLHSRETAAKFGVRSTGNARAMGYANAPIVRMSNTFFERGEMKKEEIFEVKSALCVKGMRGGQVIPKNGTYVFAAEEGFVVEKGEIKGVVRDVLLTGMILETLRKVDAVASDFAFSPGMCGKAGQSVPVSDGGPHIRIRGVRVGGVRPNSP
ncbi:MAG: TldD/PmbA family protein [Candidatus Micrarchaeia archaeon]